MTVQATLEGADHMADTLHAAARQLGDLTAAHQAASDHLAADAAGRAPRLTGRLAGSLTATATATEAVVGSTLVYAAVIHNGWPGHNIRPTPFLTLAATTTDWPAPYLEHANDVLATVKGTTT